MSFPLYWIPNPMLPLPTQIVCIDCKKGEKCKGTMVNILVLEQWFRICPIHPIDEFGKNIRMK